jgi:hypothetical protein
LHGLLDLKVKRMIIILAENVTASQGKTVVYGEKVLKKENIGVSKLEIQDVEGKAARVFVSTPYGDISLVVPLSPGDEFRLYPVLPIHTPKLITTYLIYVLKDPIVLDSKDKVVVTLETYLELGLALYNSKENRFGSYITFIPPFPMKFALYGPPETGYVGRMIETSAYLEDILKISVPEYKALTRLTIRNYSDEVVTVKRILVNSSQMNIFYDDFGRAYTNDLDLAVMSSSKGHVNVTKRVPLPGLKRSIEPITLGTRMMEPMLPLESFYRDERKTVMSYGFASWKPNH